MTDETNDLSHWAVVTHFSMREAAYLAVGADPMADEHPPAIVAKARLLEREMSAAFDRALERAGEVQGKSVESRAPDIWGQDEDRGRFLPSEELRGNIKDKGGDPEHTYRRTWQSTIDPWHMESFRGDDLAAWFRDNNFSTVFDFKARRARNVRETPSAKGEGAGPWPWGARSTHLLRELAAAEQKFWALYEPADPSTAPTSKQVISWLMDREVSERAAQGIAQILRADGLPTGPRK